jgi:hypothetical protein
MSLLSNATRNQEFTSSADARRVYTYANDKAEKRRAKRYLDKRAKHRRKRAKLIEKVKCKLGEYSPELAEATELWAVNDALSVLTKQRQLTPSSQDRRIYLKCLRYLDRLKKMN